MAAPPDHGRRCTLGLSFALLLALHASFFHVCMARATPGGTAAASQRRIDAIYNFGDSISDTGNLLRELGGSAVFGRLPYGETMGFPTGRFSDGLLMIDYLARFLNLPYLPPSLDKSANFDHGANFAVAGATALNRSFFLERGIYARFTNSSLGVQLQWFKNHLSSLCTSKEDCKRRLESALFLVGEIGGNDYNYGFGAHKTIGELKTYVPTVVATIVNAAKELIELGAVHLIVPGNFPIGCFPCFLTSHKGQFPFAPSSCIEDLNAFAEFHNDALQGALSQLRMEHPGVTIQYADYYNAFLALLSPGRYGFNQDSLFKACCGIGGPYNYDPSHRCGTAGVPVCPDPAKFISWDGVHLTQEAYRNMAAQIFWGLIFDKNDAR